MCLLLFKKTTTSFVKFVGCFSGWEEMMLAAGIWLFAMVSCLVSGMMGFCCFREKSTAEAGLFCQHRIPVKWGFIQSALNSPAGFNQAQRTVSNIFGRRWLVLLKWLYALLYSCETKACLHDTKWSKRAHASPVPLKTGCRNRNK